MKDFIVLIATILLGVVLAGLVLGFQTSANNINQKATNGIVNVFDGFSSLEMIRS